LRSLNHTAEIVDCFDEMSGTGGFHRAPPLKLKEHTRIVAGEKKAVKRKMPNNGEYFFEFWRVGFNACSSIQK
jgi:hypothetical protein